MSSWAVTEEKRTNLVVAAIIAAALSPGLIATAARADLSFFERSSSSVASCTAVTSDPTYCSEARDDSVYLPGASR